MAPSSLPPSSLRLRSVQLRRRRLQHRLPRAFSCLRRFTYEIAFSCLRCFTYEIAVFVFSGVKSDSNHTLIILIMENANKVQDCLELSLTHSLPHSPSLSGGKSDSNHTLIMLIKENYYYYYYS